MVLMRIVPVIISNQTYVTIMGYIIAFPLKWARAEDIRQLVFRSICILLNKGDEVDGKIMVIKGEWKLNKYYNFISIIICGFDLVVYILFFNGIDLVSDEVVFPLMIVGSIMGIVFSWLGSKGITRNIGIFGNAFVLLFTVIVPLIVRTFIWNTP
jgi:hypothetical protein